MSRPDCRDAVVQCENTVQGSAYPVEAGGISHLCATGVSLERNRAMLRNSPHEWIIILNWIILSYQSLVRIDCDDRLALSAMKRLFLIAW